MTPLQIFLIPGQYALKLILLFLQVSPHQIASDLVKVFAFFLAIIFWAWLINVTIAIVKRIFGFGGRSRS